MNDSSLRKFPFILSSLLLISDDGNFFLGHNLLRVKSKCQEDRNKFSVYFGHLNKFKIMCDFMRF